MSRPPGACRGSGADGPEGGTVRDNCGSMRVSAGQCGSIAGLCGYFATVQNVSLVGPILRMRHIVRSMVRVGGVFMYWLFAWGRLSPIGIGVLRNICGIMRISAGQCGTNAGQLRDKCGSGRGCADRKLRRHSHAVRCVI